MKIAVITDHVPSQFAHSINSVRHAQGFYELGNKVYLIILMGYTELKEKRKLDIHEYYGIDKNIKIIEIRDRSLSFFQDFGLLGKALRYFNNLLFIYYYKYLNSIHKLLLKFKILRKIIYIINPSSFIPEVCKKLNIDIIYSRRVPLATYNAILNEIPTVMETHDFYIPLFLREILKLGEYRSFRSVITISPPLKRILSINSDIENKIITLEDAVNKGRFDKIEKNIPKLREELGIPQEKKIIMYAGTMRKNRGIDTIFQASKLIKDDLFIYYFLGGSQSELEYWREYIVSNNIQANIHFEGFVSNKIIPKYLKAADILVAPYSKKTNTLGWMSPLKVFEYMASETPFICSRVQRIIDVCKKNCCTYFEPDNSADLSKKIIKLMNNPELAENFAKNAYNEVKKYTYQSRCTEILKSIK